MAGLRIPAHTSRADRQWLMTRPDYLAALSAPITAERAAILEEFLAGTVTSAQVADQLAALAGAR
jgi:hypothetical protein